MLSVEHKVEQSRLGAVEDCLLEDPSHCLGIEAETCCGENKFKMAVQLTKALYHVGPERDIEVLFFDLEGDLIVCHRVQL